MSPVLKDMTLVAIYVKPDIEGGICKLNCDTNKDDICDLPTPEIDNEIYKYIFNKEKFIFNDVYDKNINLIYSKEELSGKIIVDRRENKE